MTTISIALCTYNGERFLQQQLDSLASQTRLPDEVVVCDDCSTDRTIEILENWQKRVPFSVHVYRNDVNLGYSKNFEKALQHTSGDIVFVCDQDDVWKENKIQTVANVFEKSPEVGAVYHDASIIDGESKRIGDFSVKKYVRYGMVNSFPAFINPDIKSNYVMLGCCGAIRSICLQKLLPIPDEFAYDHWLFSGVNAMASEVFLDDLLIEHRIHANNASTDPEFINQVIQVASKPYVSELWYYMSLKYYLDSEKYISIIKQYITDRIDDNPYKQRYLEFLSGTQRHFINKTRIRRNAIVFSPFLLIELFQPNGYFHYFQPFKSLFYDIKVGLYNAVNPFSIYQEFKNLLHKLKII